MNLQYSVPFMMGLISVISLVVPLHAFLNDNGLNLVCDVILCSLAGLLIMGLWMLWGYHIIKNNR